jgi:hypothetical protein
MAAPAYRGVRPGWFTGDSPKPGTGALPAGVAHRASDPDHRETRLYEPARHGQNQSIPRINQAGES